MRRFLTTITLLFLISILLSGCGHLDGNNPLGVTGGGANGYGSLGGSMAPPAAQTSNMIKCFLEPGARNFHKILLIGAGFYQWSYYSGQNLVNFGDGSWYSYGNIMYATEGGTEDEYPYSVTSDELTIDWGDGSPVTYHKQ